MRKLFLVSLVFISSSVLADEVKPINEGTFQVIKTVSVSDNTAKIEELKAYQDRMQAELDKWMDYYGGLIVEAQDKIDTLQHQKDIVSAVNWSEIKPNTKKVNWIDVQ